MEGSRYYEETKFIYNNLFNGFMEDFKISPNGNAAKKLARLCASAFLFGREYGKEENIRNIRLFQDKDADEISRPSAPLSHRTSEGLLMLLELYANNEFEFENHIVARKKADCIRAFAKYNQLNFKFRQEGKKVRMVK